VLIAEGHQATREGSAFAQARRHEVTEASATADGPSGSDPSVPSCLRDSVTPCLPPSPTSSPPTDPPIDPQGGALRVSVRHAGILLHPPRDRLLPGEHPLRLREPRSTGPHRGWNGGGRRSGGGGGGGALPRAGLGRVRRSAARAGARGARPLRA